MLDQYTLNLARKAKLKGDYNQARQYYQEVAYGYNTFTELEQESFTKEVAIFAKSDPIYHKILQLVKDQIKLEQEPILQSKLTNIVKLDYGEKGAELLRYVLYYAAYNDDIVRIKKGRSYLLQLPKRLTTPETSPISSSSPKKQPLLKSNIVIVEPQKKPKATINENVIKPQVNETKEPTETLSFWQQIKTDFNRPLTKKEKIYGAIGWIIILFIVYKWLFA